MPCKDRSKYQSEEYKAYIKEYNKLWYERNKAKRLAQNYERKIKMAELLQENKSNLHCADCGETHPAVLYFHHRNPEEKEFNVADFVRLGKSPEALMKEISKCIVLCANCHAKRHYKHNGEPEYDLGASGQFSEAERLVQPTVAEQAAWDVVFGNSGSVDEEYAAYQEYYGVDPRNRK
jgi:hypothetical protein